MSSRARSARFTRRCARTELEADQIERDLAGYAARLSASVQPSSVSVREFRERLEGALPEAADEVAAHSAAGRQVE